MPALKPSMSIGWPRGPRGLSPQAAVKAVQKGRQPPTPWEGVERAMGARRYSKQTIGGCASRGLGSTPERDGPFAESAKIVAALMPPHARAATNVALAAAETENFAFNLYGDALRR